MPGRPPANPHAATTPDGPAPGYDPPARWWTILRHALSIAVTTAVIVTAFTVLTLPWRRSSSLTTCSSSATSPKPF
ncbi:hypothetical protein ACFQ1I_40345 [Kitasatospora arboriphila]